MPSTRLSGSRWNNWGAACRSKDVRDEFDLLFLIFMLWRLSGYRVR